MLPEVVIVVSTTHWQCVTCKVHQSRSVSLDLHLQQSHPYDAVSHDPHALDVSHDPHTLDAPEHLVRPQFMPTKDAAQTYFSNEHEASKTDANVSLHTDISGIASENENAAENVSKLRQGRKSRKRGAGAPKKQVSDAELDDASDDEEVIKDNDDSDDSDFIPSDFQSTHSRGKSTRVSRRTKQNTPDKSAVKKRVGASARKNERVRKLRKQAEKDATQDREEEDCEREQKEEPVSEPEEHTELEQTVSDDNFVSNNDDDLSSQRKSPRNKKSRAAATSPVKLRLVQRQRRSRYSPEQEPASHAPKKKKRGRPPKPKQPEEEEPAPKRPYRKKVPDPTEMLLKLRNVGRKPNTRKKVSTVEKSTLTSRYMQFVSKGSKDIDVAYQGERIDMDDNNDSQSSHGPESSMSSAMSSSRREKVRCKTCLHVFTTDRSLQEHLLKVGREDVMQCLTCSMKFHGQSDLNLHVFCDHESESQPVCLQCSDDFPSMEQLERHLHTRHKGEELMPLRETRFHDCRLCKMELNIDSQLIRNHYYRRHKAFVCPDCFGKDTELVFYTETHMYAEHKQMHAKSPADCSICGEKFPTYRDMKAHMWGHAVDSTEDGTGGKCAKCDKCLPNSGALLMHEREHKNESIRKSYALEASIGFPCMKCQHIFSSKSNLKKHSCKADPNRAFYFHCEYCAHGCNTKEQLRDHIALHHMGIKRYSCNHCGQRFVCGPTLRRHVRRVHTKEQPYECHICLDRFYERNAMLRHVSRHMGLANFVCERCGKGFHTKYDLKKHTENHNAARDHVCPHCGLDYKRNYHLKRHLERGCKKKFVGDNPATTSLSKKPRKRTANNASGSMKVASVNTAELKFGNSVSESRTGNFVSESRLGNSVLDSVADQNIPSVMSEDHLTLHEDADVMVFTDLAEAEGGGESAEGEEEDGEGDSDVYDTGDMEEEGSGDDDEEEEGVDDDSSGPDFVDGDNDDGDDLF